MATKKKQVGLVGRVLVISNVSDFTVREDYLALEGKRCEVQQARVKGDTTDVLLLNLETGELVRFPLDDLTMKYVRVELAECPLPPLD